MADWQYEPAKDHGLPPLARAKSLKRESGLVGTLGHAAWWSCVRGIMRIYHRLEVHNPERLPKEPPFVIVANHSSHLDVLALAAPLPTRLRDRIFPVAAADVFFETPAVTMFASLMLNALPMYRANRGRHALVELRERLVGEPCALVLFPEGARSRDGEMLPVKSGIGMIVGGTDVPIVPCWLEGCFRAMPANVILPRPHKISVYVGDPVRFPQAGNNREGWDTIARELEIRIKGLRPAKGNPGTG